MRFVLVYFKYMCEYEKVSEVKERVCVYVWKVSGYIMCVNMLKCMGASICKCYFVWIYYCKYVFVLCFRTLEG